MNTYTGEPQSNKPGGEKREETDSVEDLFLPGGFDSFGGMPEPMNANMGQINNGMGQLGSTDYGSAYGTADNSTNRWSNPIIILSFQEQIWNSFMPARYGRYKGMSEGAAKEFVKAFTRLYLRIGYLLLILMMLVSLRGTDAGGSILVLAIIFGISYAISVFVEPYVFRLRAFVYRGIFGNLIMAVTKTDITSANMYLVSIFACVPCMVVSILCVAVIVLAYFSLPLLLYVITPVSWLFSICQLVIPIIIMAIAIPRME